jgi:hypothetical protein
LDFFFRFVFRFSAGIGVFCYRCRSRYLLFVGFSVHIRAKRAGFPAFCPTKLALMDLNEGVSGRSASPRESMDADAVELDPTGRYVRVREPALVKIRLIFAAVCFYCCSIVFLFVKWVAKNW